MKSPPATTEMPQPVVSDESPERLAAQIAAQEWLKTFVPRDDWERLLLSIGVDTGVSLTDEQCSRECIYED